MVPVITSEKKSEGRETKRSHPSQKISNLYRESSADDRNIYGDGGGSKYHKKAKALANLLDKITIFIEDGELIVGWPASKPMGFELEHNSTKWEDEEWEGEKGISFKEDEQFVITDKVWAEIKSLNKYWHTRTSVYRQGPLWDEERLWPYLQAGVRPPIWKNKEEGQHRGSAGGQLGYGGYFVCLDYAMLLNRGLNGLIEEAKEELRNLRFTSPDSVEKAYFSTVSNHKP